jgi:hypothetical protein
MSVVRVSNLASRNLPGISEKSSSIIIVTEWCEKFCTSAGECGKTYVAIHLPCLAKLSVLA